ncbi:MAG: hypothetical protein ACKVWV_04135 [Planctomycetota bacterium]
MDGVDADGLVEVEIDVVLAMLDAAISLRCCCETHAELDHYGKSLDSKALKRAYGGK